MAKSGEVDPRFMVEIGSERFDPKDEAAKARRQVAAGKKKLAEALGVPVGKIPGAEREAYLVQFEADPDAETVRRFVDDYGLQLKHGLSSVAFVERMDRKTAARVRRDSVVRATVPFSPALKQTVRPTEDVPSSRVAIGLIEGDDVEALTSTLQTLGLNVLLVNDDTNAGGGLSLLAEATQNAEMSAVLALDDVAWIERIGRLTIKNLDTAGVAQSGDAASHPVWEKDLHGEGMIIGVLDAGEIDLLSKFLRDSSKEGQAGASASHRKVVENRKAAGSNTPPDPAHPTWVSGSAVGDEEGEAGKNTGSHPNRGGAWGARIAYGDIFRVFGASPSGSLTAEFEAAAKAEARIHTNSWGSAVDGGAPAYDKEAQDIDAFLWQNQDHLCLVAAPNPGDPFEGALVVAKNPVVVGGVGAFPSHNERPADPQPLTRDRRRKPDLLGVAEDITTSDLTNGGANVLAVATVSANSLATPHVAAAAALVRQYFLEGWFPNGKKEGKKRSITPSGALLKAMLLNATVPLTDQPYPNDRDGWGRLELNRTLHFEGDKLLLWVRDVRRGQGLERNGRTQQHTLTVPANAKSLKVTLVFNDRKGPLPGANPVVNRLDVELMEPRPSGFGYFGNDFKHLGFDAPQSLRRDVTKFSTDATELRNNVRQVLVMTPTPGRWTIVVRAHTIDQTEPASQPGKLPPLRFQGYALVATIALT
jgi:hypothetical protein